MIIFVTEQELSEWISRNAKKYPELSLFREIVIDGVEFLNLPVKYGIYDGLYFCFEDENNSVVKKLRENNAVGIFEDGDYKNIKKILLETVRKLKSKKRKQK